MAFNLSNTRLVESFNLRMHANWDHKLALRRALTPSPSPIRWERVAAGRVRVRLMERAIIKHENTPIGTRPYGI